MSVDPQTLLERAQWDGAPILAAGSVTFIWQGASEPRLIGDFTNWSVGQQLIEASPGLWTRTLTLPSDAYLEYAFVIDGQRIPDPLNPHQADDGMGHVNSFFWGPDAHDTTLAQQHPGVAQGTLTTISVAGLGLIPDVARTVHFYQPPTDEPPPLMVVFDGEGYLAQAAIVTIVENLLAQGRIRPLALAMIEAAGPGRIAEYACNDATVAFVIHAVLPAAHSQLALRDVASTPGAFGIMGASMGGLMALYTAHRAPEIFGRVLCESGAFGADHSEHILYYRSSLEDLIERQPPPSLTIWMDVGLHEWFLGPNRRMRDRLMALGYVVTYLEHSSGHHYPSWRNVLWRGLERLFPPR